MHSFLVESTQKVIFKNEWGENAIWSSPARIRNLGISAMVGALRISLQNFT